jgi:hypothetical protein
MRLLLALAFCAVSAMAQGHVSGALGGPYLSPVISRPLGGIPPPAKKTGTQRPSAAGYRYVGPVYFVPSYDTSYGDYSAPPPLPPQQQPPVVINQYFVTPGSSIPGEAAPPPAPAAVTPASVNPGDPLTPPATYYLIAYKDHNVYSALTYWLEGDTLHYVTTQNTHNQASLSLIDADQTAKLNAARSVPFSLPGK